MDDVLRQVIDTVLKQMVTGQTPSDSSFSMTLPEEPKEEPLFASESVGFGEKAKSPEFASFGGFKPFGGMGAVAEPLKPVSPSGFGVRAGKTEGARKNKIRGLGLGAGGWQDGE